MNLSTMEKIINLVRAQLSSANCQESAAFGFFENEAINKRKRILPGAVYGFFVRLSPAEVKTLFEEATSKLTNKISKENDFKPIFDDVYPLFK